MCFKIDRLSLKLKIVDLLVWLCASVFILVLIPVGTFLYDMKENSANGRGLIWNAIGLMISDSLDRGVDIGNFTPEYIHGSSGKDPNQLHLVFGALSWNGEVMVGNGQGSYLFKSFSREGRLINSY